MWAGAFKKNNTVPTNAEDEELASPKKSSNGNHSSAHSNSNAVVRKSSNISPATKPFLLSKLGGFMSTPALIGLLCLGGLASIVWLRNMKRL